MSDCESDLMIDVKSDELIQKDYSVPSTSSEDKSGYIAKYDSKDLAEDIDSNISENNEDSDSESGERCAICLSLIRGKIGSPDAEGCEHYFCLLCILEWTKNNPTCPQDRRPFKRILVRESICGEIVSTEEVENKTEEEEPEQEDLTYCEVCGSSEREDCLLLCDGCDLGFHLDCLSPPLMEVPIEEWFCPLCVAAELPQAIKKAESSKKNEKESAKNQRKKEKKNVRKPRMIPRTRASETVLRRIKKTRFKEAKKRDVNDDREKKSKAVVHLFEKAKLFGRITDSDIDAAFNQDEYADMLLSSSSSSLSNSEKREIAAKAITDVSSNPLPSYSGRSSHPKVENCQTPDTNTDLLINILEEQDILLSKTKDVSLTKDRKLIKKEGAKSLDFNADRENRVMSDLLPSQKKALESKEKDDKVEKENSRSRDSRHRKSEEKTKHSKDHYSNGHSSSYKRSYSSPRKSRERDSHSSYKSSKPYRNYDKKLDRRNEPDYRKRDSRKYRERSRSRDRKDFSNFSGDYYDRRRSRRSRSKSRERRRTERKHKRRSRTPERHKSKERNHRDKLPSSSFWGKDFVNTFTDFDSKSNFDGYNDSVSFHTTEISSIPQKIDVNLFNTSSKTEELPEKRVSSLKEEEGLSFETYEPTHDKNTFYKSEYKEKLESLNFNSKCDNKNSFSEEKRKLEDSNYFPKIETEAKKQRLKNLFGDEESDQDSPNHHLNKSDISTYPIEEMNLSSSTKENIKDSLPKEPSSQISGLEGNSFQNYENSSGSYLKELRSDSEQNLLPINLPLPPPISLPSPSQPCGNEQDALGDITKLSKTSRDFILKSLFGNHETDPSSPIKTDSKDSSIYIKTQDTFEPDKQKSSISNKYIENTKDKFNSKVSPKSSLIEVKKNKTSKMFANLFGDSSDSEASNSALDKNSKSSLDKNSSSPLHKSSKSSFDKILKLDIDRNINSVLDKNLNSVIDKNLSSTVDKTSSSTFDKTSKSPAINIYPKEITEQEETIDISKGLQNDPEPKLSPQKEDIQEKEKSHKMMVNAIEIKSKPEKIEKTNSEGTQGIDPKSSTLSTKMKVNKLHLEMKVVEETKKFLNPFYLEKGFSKQIYKEIVSKCVSKVLEVESGNTVDPKKIQKLVNGYVQVYMHRNKKNSTSSSSAPPPPKSIV